MNGLITVAKYWHEWSDPRLVVLVLNNGDLNMVTWEQRALGGDPRFVGSQALPDMSYAGFAQDLDLLGIRLDAPGQVGSAWERALAADRPAVIDAVTDPNMPLCRRTCRLIRRVVFSRRSWRVIPNAPGSSNRRSRN